MTTKIEDLTDKQLDVLVADKVKGWEIVPKWPDGSVTAMAEGMDITITPSPHEDDYWSPTTNIAHAFEATKPGWRWDFFEWKTHLTVYVRKHEGKVCLADVQVPLDHTNRTAAYCRGIVLCALKACGVEEID